MSTGFETTRMTASWLSGFMEEKMDWRMARFRDRRDSLSSPIDQSCILWPNTSSFEDDALN
jgi:hypothetical protein